MQAITLKTRIALNISVLLLIISSMILFLLLYVNVDSLQFKIKRDGLDLEGSIVYYNVIPYLGDNFHLTLQ